VQSGLLGNRAPVERMPLQRAQRAGEMFRGRCMRRAMWHGGVGRLANIPDCGWMMGGGTIPNVHVRISVVRNARQSGE